MAKKVQIKWRLRSVMADRKMQATELATLMGVNRVTIETWKGLDVIPAFKDPTATLEALCLHLDCELSDLIEFQRS